MGGFTADSNSGSDLTSSDGLDGEPSVDIEGGSDGTDAPDGTDSSEAADGASDESTDTLDVEDVSDATDTEVDCEPGTSTCLNENTALLCPEGGNQWQEQPCNPGSKCWNGVCGPITCVPGDLIGECASPTEYLQCNPMGTSYDPVPCEAPATCYEGDCVNFVCAPGSLACVGFGAVQECRDDGSGWDTIEQCEKGGTCVEGICISACDVDLKNATYRGCEYFAVDLDNIEGGQFEPVAVVVSVPPEVENANVTVTDMSTGTALTAAEMGALSTIVASGSLGIFELPAGSDLDGTQQAIRSFHIETSAPATVHQFNPLNGEEVYTNDASLLLPSAIGGQEYFVMSWGLRKDSSNTLRGFASVIATEEGYTQVKVTPRAAVAASDDSSVQALEPGLTYTFELVQGEVLNLEATGEQGDDLTGTYVTSDQPIVVFGGHECANVPLGITACDHLEQQLVPVTAWGKRYIVDQFKPRDPNGSAFDVVRVLAGDNDVLVTTTPPQPGYEQFLLQPGAYVTFTISGNVDIDATGPILVGHFMTGSSYPGHIKTCENTGVGDPALTLTVPTVQFLDEYTVLTPPGYLQNYLNITSPPGANILVDGVPLSSPLIQVAPGIDWAVAQHPVEPGVHTVTAAKKIGLTAYGYDCDVSYAYPGGLRLQNLLGGQ